MSSSSQLSTFPLRRRNIRLDDLEIILDLISDALLLVDSRSKRIILANARATELTSYTRAELSNLELGALFHKLDERSFWAKQASELPYHQLILKKRNKTSVDVQVTATTLPSEGKWSLIAITEIQAIEARERELQRQGQQWNGLRMLALAPQQLDFAAALDQAVQAGISLTGATNLFVYQAAGQSLELRRCASWGKDLPDQLPSQDLGHLRAPHLWAHGKRSLSVLHRAARSAGFSYLASAPLGQPNALIGLVAVGGTEAAPGDHLLPLVQFLAGMLTGIIQHHTQLANLRLQMQEQLRTLKMYEAAQEAIQDSVIVLSPDFNILRLNHSAEIALGYSSQEVRGQPFENVLIGTETIKSALEDAVKKGIPTYGQGEARLYRRSGQAFLAQMVTLPVLIGEEVQGVVILIQDLSEKEQIQVHAQQLEQRALLGEVTAVFAHEVRNPMNNISTGLQLMALNHAPDDPNQEMIQRLQQDCDRLAELMKSVLSFSHPTEYEMEAVDLRVFMERLIERLRPKLTRANVKHLLQTEPATPLVKANPRALEQVFNNLITNALQAMEEKGGTLAVKIQPVIAAGRRRQVEVSVADSGPGIPKELLERIFQPFFTTKNNGTGLGLAITKRIITAHKGTIRVNSFPGGTVFQVQLPEYKQGGSMDLADSQAFSNPSSEMDRQL